jgi:hypothetical protein
VEEGVRVLNQPKEIQLGQPRVVVDLRTTDLVLGARLEKPVAQKMEVVVDRVVVAVVAYLLLVNLQPSSQARLIAVQTFTVEELAVRAALRPF